MGLGAFHRNILRLEAETFDPRNTGRVIVNSEMVKREILSHFAFPADRIHLVRNGVDVARFQGGDRTATRRRLGIQDDDFLLLFVGSGWERKGLTYALRAVRALQMVTLLRGFSQGVQRFVKESKTVLAGALGPDLTKQTKTHASQPPSPGKIKLLVVGKGKRPAHRPANVLFAGPMSAPENAYAAADLFLFLPIYEPSSNVVFEALAAGLPVVTTAQNGAAELIEEGVNGTVVDDPANIEEVVEEIAYWWSRRFYVPPVNAAELSLDRNVSETLAVLEQAARERRIDEK